jgi:signal transduction histidine kinase
MLPDDLLRHYRDLQAYVGWTDKDEQRIRVAGKLVAPSFGPLIEDFYEELVKHPAAEAVIREGPPQIERLKLTLAAWLHELFNSEYDVNYVVRRWRVGLRHVEIGLDQTYANAALSRLRSGLSKVLEANWRDPAADLFATERALNKLIDLDLSIIELAYQTEFHRRQKQTDRLAAIGQVAGGVAHEVRNPLNVIKTSVYFLLNAKNPQPEKILAHLQRIERQVELADQVVTALNDFARLPVPEMHPLELEPFLHEVLELNPPGDGIRVELNRAVDARPVLGDPQQLRIVFGNLIRNARDAMPDGGSLNLTIRQLKDEVEVDIRDTGVGIRPEDLGKVMEPLFSTKTRGIGLGLSITRAIVEKHSGKLSVASQLGAGTTFTVRLQTPPEDGCVSGT